MSTTLEPLAAPTGYQPPVWSAAAPPPAKTEAKKEAKPKAKTASEPVDRLGASTPTKQPDWLLDPKSSGASLKRRPPAPPKGELKIDDMKRQDMKRPASDINTDDMVKMFGPDGARLKDMAKERPDITIGNLMRLKRVGIDQVYDATKLLQTRPDLNLNDIIDNVGNGNALMKPATYHNEARALMDQREGTKPDDLAAMGDQFRHTYGDQAGKAFGKAADLLHYRKDLNTAGLEAQARGAGLEDSNAAYDRFAQNYADGRTTNNWFNLL